MNSVQRRIEEVPGAVVTNIEENRTGKAIGDMPPHSTRFTVEGGDEQAIGEAMASVVPGCVNLVGAIEISAAIRFSRPKNGQADPKSGKIGGTP